MVNKKSSLDIVIAEFSRALTVLERYADTPESGTQFLAELGYKMPATVSVFDDILGLLPGHLTTLNMVLAKIDAGAFDDPSFLSDIQSLLGSTIDLVDAISQLSTKVENALSVHADFLNNSGIKDDLPIRLLNYLILKHLAENHPALYSFLLLTGIARITFVPEDTYNPDFYLYEVKWGSLTSMIKNPAFHFKEVYGWGTSSYNSSELFAKFSSLLWALGIPTANTDPDELNTIVRSVADSLHGELTIKVPLIEDFIEFGSGPEDFGGYEVGIIIYPTEDFNNDANGGIGVCPYLFGQLNSTVDITKNWKLSLVANVELDEAIGLHITPANGIDIVSSGASGGDVRVEAKITKANPDKIVLLSIGGGGGFEVSIGGIAVDLKALLEQGQPVITSELILERCGVVIGGEGADGFLQKILPKNGINTDFDIAVGWSSVDGFYFRGSAALEVTLPIHKTLGPITVESVYLSINVEGGIVMTLAASASAKIGPVSASIDQVGINIPIKFPPKCDGNLGPVQIDAPKFKPPTGTGISIDAGGIVGSGVLAYYEVDKTYFAGLGLSFGEIGLTAIGLITTKMPDGSKGFALLINIGVIFNPAIQLSFGFTLTGVGGLIAVNCTMEVDVLRVGVKNRTLDSILFPNPSAIVANSQKIISDMRTVFPPKEGRFIIGPMVKIGWGTPNIITADIGIFLELPDPIRIVLMGQLEAVLPEKTSAIVVIHLDILGVLDLAKSELTFQASLYDSRVLLFTMYGDAAFLLAWGNDPRFALSIGGFHPKFNPPPPPAVFADLKRLTICIGSGPNLQLSCRAYQALTPNSLQFGARVDLYASAAGATIKGYLGFETLIYFSPSFSFEVWMGAGVQISYEGVNLLSVELSFLLAGPTPWLARGKAKIEILFISVTVKFCITWGKEEKATLPAWDPWEDLLNALQKPDCWGAVLPAGRKMVESLRVEKGAASSQIVVHSSGRLEVRQNVVPLGRKLSMAANAPITGHDCFDISDIKINGVSQNLTPVEEYFARGQWEDLGSGALSVPSFENMKAGVSSSLESASFYGDVEYQCLQYESILINEDRTSKTAPDKEKAKLKWADAQYAVKAKAKRSALSRAGQQSRFSAVRSRPKVHVKEDRYCIVNASDLHRAAVALEGGRENRGMTRGTADQMLKAYLYKNPDRVQDLMTVPECEVAA